MSVQETHEERAARINAEIDNMPTNTGWQTRHRAQWTVPTKTRTLVNGERMGNRGIVGMLKAWALYADDHKAAYGSGIGDDYVLGAEWAEIGYALRGMLNGELGALDGGTLDTIIAESLGAEGFSPEIQGKRLDEVVSRG